MNKVIQKTRKRTLRKVRRDSGARRTIRRSLRQRNISVVNKDGIAKRMKDSDGTVGMFFSEEIPYLNTGKYKLLLDGYIIDNPQNASETYNINTKLMTIEKTTMEGEKDETLYDFINKIVANKNRYFAIGKEKIPIGYAFFFKYTYFLVNNIWLNENKADRISKSLKKKLNEYFSVDPPLSTKANFIHLFIFLNKFPLLLKCMIENDKAGVRKVLSDSGFTDDVMTSIQEVRALALETHGDYNSKLRDIFSENPRNKEQIKKELDAASNEEEKGRLNKEMKTEEKRLKMISTFLPVICSDKDEILCSNYKPNIDELATKIDDIRKMVSELNKIEKNLGFIFLLNYWLYRIMHMPSINNIRFPINRHQQLKSMLSILGEEKTEIDSDPLEDILEPRYSIPLIEAARKYIVNGITYSFPNCVETAVFELIQIMMYDSITGNYDTSIWSSIDPTLKTYMENLRPPQQGEQVPPKEDWNELVCGKEYDYRSQTESGEGYNIKSYVGNVLKVLNNLSGGTNYKSLPDWVKGVYKGNITDVSENRILLNGYAFYIGQGHTYIEPISLEEEEEDTRKKPIKIDSKIPYLSIFKMKPRIGFDKEKISGKDLEIIFTENDFDDILNDDDFLFENNNKDLKIYLIMKRMDRGIESVNRVLELFSFSSLNMNMLKGRLSGEKTITLKRCFPTPVEKGVLPEGLERLIVYTDNESKLENLFIPGVFPSTLKTLYISYASRYEERENFDLTPGILPLGLEALILQYNFYGKIEKGALPQGLKYLVLPRGYSESLGEGILPEGLEHIGFGNADEYEYEFMKKPDYSINQVNLQPLKLEYLRADIEIPISIQNKLKEETEKKLIIMQEMQKNIKEGKDVENSTAQLKKLFGLDRKAKISFRSSP